MNVTTGSVSEHSVLVLGGAVTAEDAPELRRRLGELLTREASDVVICDLSDVRSMDPQAMTVFASQHSPDEGPGPAVCVVGARGDVADVLDRLQIPRFVRVAPTVEAALELVRSRPPRLCAVRPLAGASAAPRLARRFAREVCAEWGLDDVVEDVELVVGELVSNAVDHAGTDVVVRLERTVDHVTVAVRDGASGLFPSWWRGEAEDDAEPGGADEPVWGHGLTIVRALAETAGVHSDAASGKVVWAVLRARTASPNGHARPLRRQLTVNSGRAQHDSGRWVVRLELAWLPERPEQVTLTLTSRPQHPSLPRGRFQVSRSALRDGLRSPVRHGSVRLWPDRAGRELVLELPARPPRVVRVPASRVRQFLDAAGGS